jgi:hypothetical protein
MFSGFDSSLPETVFSSTDPKAIIEHLSFELIKTA